MPKFKNSNATFWVSFKQFAVCPNKFWMDTFTNFLKNLDNFQSIAVQFRFCQLWGNWLCKKRKKNGFWHFSSHRFLRYGLLPCLGRGGQFFPFSFLALVLLSPGFLVSMTGARYGIAFLWFRYILWWKLHFMVHWLPCSSQCSKHPFLSSGIQERDAPNHVSIGTSMHKITR